MCCRHRRSGLCRADGCSCAGHAVNSPHLHRDGAYSATAYSRSRFDEARRLAQSFSRAIALGLFCALLFALGQERAFAVGAIDAFTFENPADQARYERLIDEFRCPKCLNTNLSGSDAPIAADLRAMIYRKVIAGESDAAIRDYLQARYGDFVLYDPPVRAGTIALWMLPAALFVVGVGAIFVTARRSRRASAPLAADEAERLTALLRGEQIGDEPRR
jgi:cytochrome c-type biogenesis protein CcmH